MTKERTLILFCEPNCPFGRRCGDKYTDGECRDRVTDIDGVLGSPEGVKAQGSTVSFKLVDPIIKPAHNVVVETGVAHVSEDG